MLNFRSLIASTSPWWLGSGTIGKVTYTIGLHLDALVDMTEAAVRKRFPEDGSQDATALLCQNRRIQPGYFAEHWFYLKGRLRRWREAHKNRGGPYEMLRQASDHIQPGTGSIPTIELQYYGVDHMKYVINTVTGVVTRYLSSWLPDLDGTRWARWRLTFNTTIAYATEGNWGDAGTYGDGGVWGSNLTAEDVEHYRAIAQEWGNAHSTGVVTITGPGQTVTIGRDW